jgi:hypothetical protein
MRDTWCKTSLITRLVCIWCIAAILFVCYDDNLNDSIDPPIICAPASFYNIDALLFRETADLYEVSSDLKLISFSVSLLRAPPVFARAYLAAAYLQLSA